MQVLYRYSISFSFSKKVMQRNSFVEQSYSYKSLFCADAIYIFPSYSTPHEKKGISILFISLLFTMPFSPSYFNFIALHIIQSHYNLLYNDANIIYILDLSLIYKLVFLKHLPVYGIEILPT